MKKCYLFFFLSLIAFLYFSCRKPDMTPAYLLLSVEDFEDCIDNDRGKFNAEHNTDFNEKYFEVIRQHNFRDVYVSLNGTALGYWHLPCKIPILPNYANKNNIRIIPCVRFINSTVTTNQYVFLKPIERFFDIEKEEKIKFTNLKFEYWEGVRFPVLETFEQSTDFSSLDAIHGADITTNQYVDGKQVGKIELNDSLFYFNVATNYFPLLGQGVRHFWEISYKCDGEMFTYLNFRNTPSGAVHQEMTVHPSTKGVWKKAYIDITDIISLAAGTAKDIEVRLGIRGLRNEDSDSQNANFYFEYVKLITMVAPY